MNKYTLSKDKTIGRYAAVEMESNPEDYSLVGERGEIWDFDGKGAYKGYLFNGAENEKIFYCNIKDLTFWILKIKVPSDAKRMVYLANNPNSRLNG